MDDHFTQPSPEPTVLPVAPPVAPPAAPLAVAAPPTPLERVKESLAACEHPRGTNWTPRTVTVGKGRKVKKVPGWNNPCIQLYADDVVDVCGLVPAEKRDQVVNDLEAGCEELAGHVPPVAVHIHVDHAHHLADLASGLSPTPPRQPGAR